MRHLDRAMERGRAARLSDQPRTHPYRTGERVTLLVRSLRNMWLIGWDEADAEIRAAERAARAKEER